MKNTVTLYSLTKRVLIKLDDEYYKSTLTDYLKYEYLYNSSNSKFDIENVSEEIESLYKHKCRTSDLELKPYDVFTLCLMDYINHIMISQFKSRRTQWVRLKQSDYYYEIEYVIA